MARFYVPQPCIEGEMLRIDGREVRHIRRVLRLKTGDEIGVFDGLAREYEGTIVEENPTSVVIKIRKIHAVEEAPRTEITLAQSLLKGEKMDYLVQKATELGVSVIAPFFSSRSVPLLERSGKLRRHHRWERIAVEASKQCGRTTIPRIEPLKDYTDVLQTASGDTLRLVPWERGGMRLKEVIEGAKQKKSIFFVVGPEGGLSQEEIEEAKSIGFVPVTLGERILRSETASLCLLSILQYEWDDLG